MRKSLKSFPVVYSLSALNKIRDNFVKELELAMQGKKTSLAFIKNPLPYLDKPADEIFQVMSIGGSIFESALAHNSNEGINLFNFIKEKLPVFKNRELFLSFFSKHLNSRVKTVIINFAFGLKPVVRNCVLDGIFTKIAKGHTFSGLLGKAVGQELENYVFQKTKRCVTVSVANDTVCLLLSGLEFARWNSIVGGVVGTGINFAFFLNKDTAVNLESADFDKFELSPTGKIIDELDHPGDFLFEKEVAGAYLYQHFNLTLKWNGIKFKPFTSTKQLSLLAEQSNEPFSTIAQKLLEHSASLIACQIAGIYLFKKFETLSTKSKTSSNFQNSNVQNISDLGFRISDLFFIMEGSLFWQGWKYKEMVKHYLLKLDVPKNSVNFIRVKHSNLIGAARLIC